MFTHGKGKGGNVVSVVSPLKWVCCFFLIKVVNPLFIYMIHLQKFVFTRGKGKGGNVVSVVSPDSKTY